MFKKYETERHRSFLEKLSESQREQWLILEREILRHPKRKSQMIHCAGEIFYYRSFEGAKLYYQIIPGKTERVICFLGDSPL